MFLQDRFKRRAPFRIVLLVLALFLVGMIMGGALVAGATQARAAEIAATPDSQSEIAHRRGLRVCLPLLGQPCHPQPLPPRRLRHFR